MKTPTKAGILVGAALLGLASAPSATAREVRYNRDVRPILSDKCFRCHGPDKAARKAELRLDLREEAVRDLGGYAAIVPGESAASELVARIFHEDRDEMMPPPKSHKKLTPREKETLKLWIEAGAEYEAHWAYIPPVRPAVPRTAAASTEIDAFVEARLKKEGLKPAGAADPITLVRRLSFDLTGLPPTPEEARDFAGDGAPDAWELLVDRLLASPHYGERMAVPWLDLVRYADTVGYHGDQPREASPFRDYVIASFNANKPFDQMTREHLAGDLLPGATLESKIAASYSRLNQISEEGGIQDREYIAKYYAERVRTTASAWLGSTMACAECHDHKFDPFTMVDFYSFAAYFSDLLEKGAYTGDGRYQEDFDLAGLASLRMGKWGPELEVPTAEEREKIAEIEKALAGARAKLARDTPALRDGFVKWKAATRAEIETDAPRDFVYLEDKGERGGIDTKSWTFVAKGKGPVKSGRFSRRQEGEGVVQHLFTGSKEPLETAAGDVLYAWVLLDPDHPPKQVMLQFHVKGWEHRAWWGEDLIPFGKGADGPDHAAMGALPATGEWVRLEAPVEKLGLAPGAKITGMAFTQFGGLAHWDQSGVRTRNPKYRWADVPAPVLAALKKAEDKVTEKEGAALLAHYRGVAPELEGERGRVAALEAQREQVEKGMRTTLAAVSATPRTVRVLPRGNWMDESGPVVTPAPPRFLAPAGGEPAVARRQTRLDLAHWLVSRDNPLTARVFVNRLWKQFFGNGLSKVLDDVGSQGEWPVHPELLDWLAVEFMESGWNVKHIVKLIVMSDVYRRSSVRTPELDAADPFNRLLARQSALRLEAEFIRDNALAVSGLLNRAVGGRSARPYQPAGYYQHLNFPKREYEPDLNEDQYRRGIYTHWQRTFLHPALVAFDAPTREECTAERTRSNTPLQALTLLNDPSWVEAARALAERVMREEKEDAARVRAAFVRCLSREPAPEELEALVALHRKQRGTFAAGEPEAVAAFLAIGMKKPAADLDPVELAAMTGVARALLNLHETIVRY